MLEILSPQEKKQRELTKRLQSLRDINAKVNEQLTAPNFSPEVECFTLDVDEAELVALSDEERVQRVAELTQKMLVEKLWPAALAHDNDLMVFQLAELAGSKEQSRIRTYIARFKNYLKSNPMFTEAETVLATYTQQDVDRAIAAFQDKAAGYEKLSQNRKKLEGKLKTDLLSMMQAKSEEMESFLIVSNGYKLKRDKVSTGFCGEFSALTVINLLDTELFYGNKIEQVSANLGDDADNHAFILVNRAEPSELNDYTTWGDDCILVDSWSKTTMTIGEYRRSKHRLLFMESLVDGKAVQIKSTTARSTVDSLKNPIKYFAIMGLDTSHKQEQAVMNEFELTPLKDDDQTAALTQYLKKVLAKVRPDELHTEFDLFLTTTGKQPISYVPCLDKPGIAFHVDFLKEIANPQGEFCLADLDLALHSLLLQFTYSSPELRQQLLPDTHAVIDKQCLADGYGPNHLIELFRKLIRFNDTHQHEVAIGVPSSWGIEELETNYGARIKVLETLSAAQKIADVPYAENKLGAEAAVLSSIKKPDYFTEEFNQLPDKVSKLRYLGCCCRELKEGLFPYEHSNYISNKVKEFTGLLESLKIDWNNPDEEQAADDFLNTLYQEQIYEFEVCYKALLGNKEALSMRGPYKPFHDFIEGFFNASTALEAIFYARKTLEFVQLHQDILYDSLPGVVYERASLAKKENKSEEFSERVFGASFSMIDMPRYSLWEWDRHLSWMKAHDEPLIAQCLWLLGLHINEDLFNFLGREYVDALIKESSQVNRFSTVSDAQVAFAGNVYRFGKNHEMRSNLYSYFFKYFGAKETGFDAGALEDPNEQNAIQQYIKKNRLLVSMPVEGANLDNAAIQRLIEYFKEIETNSKEAQKKQLKAFYLSQDENESIVQLIKPYGIYQIDLESPFVQYILTSSLFTAKEKFYCLRNIVYVKFGLKELITILGTDYDAENLSAEHINNLVASLIALDEAGEASKAVERFLKNNLRQKKILLFSQEYFECIQLINRVSSTARVMRSEFNSALYWVLPRAEKVAYDQIMQVINDYHYYESQLVLPSNEFRNEFGELVLALLARLNTVEEKVAALEILLCNPKFSGQLINVDLRTKAIKLWAENAAILYGQDTGTQDWFDKVKVKIDAVVRHAATFDAKEMLKQWCDKVSSQHMVSEYIGLRVEPELYMPSATQNKQNGFLSYLASVSKVFGANPVMQEATMGFLSQQLTSQTVGQFADLLVTELNKLAQKNSNLYCDVMEVLTGNRYAKVDYGKIVENLPGFYQNFWSQGLAERAVIANYILIPVSDVVTEEKALNAYKMAASLCLGRVFPNLNTHDETSEDRFAYDFLLAYINAADAYQRQFLIVALIVASCDVTSDKTSLSVGKKLAILLENMGPAYIKLAQAIHSHPQTPESIKKDLAHVKTKANPPSRWALWRMVDDVLPEVQRKQVGFLGPLLGAASFNLAVSLNHKEHGEVVLSLLRDRASKDAHEGFKHLDDTVASCNNETMLKNRPTFRAMIEEASKSSTIEMDPKASGEQFSIAEKVYQYQAKEEGYQIRIFPSRLLANGDGFRIISKMEGIEFNDLVAMPEYQEEARIIAKHILRVELTNILKGNCFDSDRHGNQLKILIDKEVRTIDAGLYDFGEMLLDPPNAADLAVFSEFLQDIPERRLLDIGLVDGLITYIKRKTDEGVNVAYLMKIQKAFMALHDFLQLFTPEEQEELLINIMKQNMEAIHPGLHKSCQLVVSLAERQVTKNTIFWSLRNFSLFFGDYAEQFERDHPSYDGDIVTREIEI